MILISVLPKAMHHLHRGMLSAALLAKVDRQPRR
jgi:hypothetical protein